MTAGELTIASRVRASLGARVAWVGWLMAAGLAGVGVLLLAMTGWQAIPGSYGFPGFTAPFALSYGTIGAFVLARRPGNRVGQVLLVTGILAGFQTFYTAYAIYGLISHPGSLPLATYAAWLLAWAWLPFVFLGGPTLLSIFPDGQFVSDRWRRMLITSACVTGLVMFALAFRVGSIDNFATVENPFGVIPPSIDGPIVAGGFVVISLSIIGAAASLVVRYRRADQDRRQQLKWLAAASVLLAIETPLGFFIDKVGQALFLAAVAALPAATGIAVLRYGLYEIDTIINRALVYGLLTAIIAGIYTASIGVMQRLSNTFLGGNSEATIVVTTVLIVTAFTPIKSRLQMLVDRRFKDAGDAKSTLEPFTRELHQRTWAIEPRLVLRRFAELLVGGLRAATVEVSQDAGGGSAVRGTATGLGNPGGTWSAAATVGAITLRVNVALGPRGISPRDEEAVRQALAAVASEFASD